MKHKLPEAKQNAVAGKKGRAAAGAVLPKGGKLSGDTLKAILFAVLLFAAMTVQTGKMTMILVAIAFLSVVPFKGKRMEHLSRCLSVPVLGLLGFALVSGLAAVYSPFDSDAVAELYKFLAAFSLAVILLSWFEKRHTRSLLWGGAAVSSIIAFLSIDMAADGRWFKIFKTVTEALDGHFSDIIQAPGRISGIYGDANVTANLFAVAVLVLLYLLTAETSRNKRFAAYVLLGVCSQGFILSMSRGAIVILAVAMLVMLAAVGKEQRLRLFLLMFAAAAVAVAGSAAVMAVLYKSTLLAELLVLASGLLIFAADRFAGARLLALLEGNGRRVAGTVAALAALCVAYAVTAVTVTTAYTFDESAYFTRAVQVSSGTYEVSGDWDDGVYVWVVAKTRAEVLMGRETEVYAGPLAGAAFTIPEGTIQAEFRFNGTPGTKLKSLTLSDGTKVPLGYPLMPEFLAVRVQGGIFADNSVLLRLQYMKDALTLFAQSPLVGHGLASTVNLYPSVQPFFYESRYVHNHILQVMSDTGLVGVIFFAAFLGGVLWLLVRQLRKERDGLAAVLLACWVMINLHGLMEISFSVRGYLCAAFSVLVLPVVLYARPLSEKKRVARSGTAVFAGAAALYLAVFGVLLGVHRSVAQKSAQVSPISRADYMETLKGYIRTDVFDNARHKLNFVGNAVLSQDDLYDADMERWAEDLRRSGTYTNCSGLARYYYLPRGEYEEMFACSREGIAQVASLDDGWNLQMDFYRGEVLDTIGPEDVERYLDGVLALGAGLDAYNEGRMDTVALSEKNAAFLTLAQRLREGGISGSAAYLTLAGNAAN
ncbi:MAG: O-antigen ligase family protein [Ruminococcaceae bacterium]|nr:O-antigen ligase family protein [Oscillospiraceae bacterium]